MKLVKYNFPFTRSRMGLPHLFLFLVMSFTPTCGPETPLNPVLLSQLREMYQSKLAQLKESTKENIAGWPSDTDCDGSLWAGIARSAGATWVDMTAALQEDGRPTRRPLRDCIAGIDSETTISNDMITGIILGFQAASDGASINKMYLYGETNKWIMGTPEYYISRVLLRPNGITLMAKVLYQITKGEIDNPMRLVPVLYGPVQADYEQHLLLLSRIIEQKAGGPQYGMEIAEKILAQSAPLDALAQAVAGHLTQGALLLTNNYTSPTYVRGHENYHLVHWLLAAKLILDRNP